MLKFGAFSLLWRTLINHLQWPTHFKETYVSCGTSDTKYSPFSNTSSFLSPKSKNFSQRPIDWSAPILRVFQISVTLMRRLLHRFGCCRALCKNKTKRCPTKITTRKKWKEIFKNSICSSKRSSFKIQYIQISMIQNLNIIYYWKIIRQRWIYLHTSIQYFIVVI